MPAKSASDTISTSGGADSVGPALKIAGIDPDAPGGELLSTPSGESDESLALRLRGGDAVAGDLLVKRYHPALIRYLNRLAGSDQMAEELHQQTWLSVLDHIDRFDPKSSSGGFKAWLFRIATNKTNDHWRSKGRERSATEGLKLVTDDVQPGADDRLESTEEQEKLKRAIQLLPESQRQVLMLRYYSNLKFVEIAQLLGCPLNTALGRMHKATQKLKVLMEQMPRSGV
jgi:RNA polymerase sigma-70 factor (ECF subfamily)